MNHLNNFKNFNNNLNEGKHQKALSTKDLDVKMDLLYDKVENILKSNDAELIKIDANTFEVNLNDANIAYIIFNPNYIGVKKFGDKFSKEFKHKDLGKVKKYILEIVRDNKE